VVRSVPDRDSLTTGVRVQLSWVKHDPYTQRADLSVSDRLGDVIERDGNAWIVLDTEGARHRLEDENLEEATADPTAGRWRIEGAIPTYAMGERLLLRWQHRNRATPKTPRPDTYAIVIAEEPHRVRLRLDDGSECLMFRWGSQYDAPKPKEPR
jgi:hypothetical protein